MTVYTAQPHVAFGDTWSETQHNVMLDNIVVGATVRLTTEASNATPTPNCDTTKLHMITAQAAAAAFAAPTGTPVTGQQLIIAIRDNGTARAITWDAIYSVVGTTLPLTTVINKWTYVSLMYNATAVKWHVLAVAQEV